MHLALLNQKLLFLLLLYFKMQNIHSKDRLRWKGTGLSGAIMLSLLRRMLIYCYMNAFSNPFMEIFIDFVLKCYLDVKNASD